MSFADVVARTWRDNRLLSVLLELTYRCNLDCFFCYNDLSRRGEALSTAEWVDLLDQLAEMEVLNLVLSGGEPLSHPDFLRIGSRARELGFAVRIKSNGHTLRGDLARRIRDRVDPFMIETSLHGACAETHDRQTRVVGSFERLVGNLREWRELGFRVQINSTLTRWNEDELEAMFALADDLGFPLRVDPEVTPRDDGDREPLSIQPSASAVARLLRLVAERRLQRPGPEPDDPTRPAAAPDSGKHCGAGSATLAIDPFGNVYPCVQWRRPAGNLRQQRLRDLWSGDGALTEIRQLGVEIKAALGAARTPGMRSFCPGSAELATGSPFGEVRGEREEESRGRVASLPIVL